MAARREHTDEERRAILHSFANRGAMSVAEWEKKTGIENSRVYTWRKQMGSAPVATASAPPLPKHKGKKSRQTFTDHERLTLMKEYQESSMSLDVFCASKGIQTTSMRRWHGDHNLPMKRGNGQIPVIDRLLSSNGSHPDIRASVVEEAPQPQQMPAKYIADMRGTAIDVKTAIINLKQAERHIMQQLRIGSLATLDFAHIRMFDALRALTGGAV